MNVRLLPLADWDGPTNMSADEALLEAAIAGTASLRFYTWSVPTASLGYFQPAGVRESQASLVRLPFVRRCTGGATLVHHHELTYALALPAGAAWQPRGLSWICRMHEIIARALSKWNIAARVVACGEEQKAGDVLCFQHQTPGDLLVAGHKIAGSAQRKSRGALLQHGGILLRQGEHAPALPGLFELSGVDLKIDGLCEMIQDAFSVVTSLRLKLEQWSVKDVHRVHELKRHKYATEAWNLKR